MYFVRQPLSTSCVYQVRIGVENSFHSEFRPQNISSFLTSLLQARRRKSEICHIVPIATQQELIDLCLKKFGKCCKRLYCSKQCQAQDWRTGHNIYCGVAGEIGVDFEIRPADESKGLGTFALRDFEENENI